MKVLVATLVLALLLPGSLYAGMADDASVLIQNPTDRSEHGSGVLIGHNKAGELLVLTARHVATIGPLEVVFRDGRVAPVIRTYVQKANAAQWAGDVAVLVAPHVPGVVVAALSSSDALAGAFLTVVGNPMMLRFHANFARAGRVVRVRWLGETDDLLIDSPMLRNIGRVFDSLEVRCVGCGPGDSGAGVFDEAGKLVGVMYGIRYDASDERDDRATSFVVPISAIRPLLYDAL